MCSGGSAPPPSLCVLAARRVFAGVSAIAVPSGPWEPPTRVPESPRLGAENRENGGLSQPPG